MTEANGGSDERVWRAEFRSLVSGSNLVVLIAAIAGGVWGVFDSMTDAGGDRFAGTLMLAAPAVYAGWCMLELAWKKLASLAPVLLRIVSACIVAPALVAVPVGLIQAVTVVFPGVRDAIVRAKADNGGFHYYWDEGIASQLLLVPLGGYVVGMSIAFGVALIVTLPVLSIRAPHVLAAGSHLEKLGGARGLSTAMATATAFVFVGLGATMLGIVLWVFGEGGHIEEFPAGVGRFLRSLSYGYVDADESIWLLGVVFVVGGVLVMGWGCVRVLLGRGRAARG